MYPPAMDPGTVRSIKVPCLGFDFEHVRSPVSTSFSFPPVQQVPVGDLSHPSQPYQPLPPSIRSDASSGSQIVIPPAGAASPRASAQRFLNVFQESPFVVAVAALDDGEILFQNELSSSFCADKRVYLDALFFLQPESEKQVREIRAM